MTVKLWTLKGEVVQTLGGHRSGVKSVSFGPDGQQLVSSDSSGNVILWNVMLEATPERLLTRGCNWVEDYLQTNPHLSAEERNLCDRL
jgi:WD40 repeat protein